MIWAAKTLLVIEVAAITSAICAVVAAIGFYFIARLFGVHDMNGGLAMGAVWQIGPIGAVIGAGVGIWLGILAVRAASDLTTVIASLGIAIIAGAITALVYWQPFKNDGNPYDLNAPRPVAYLEVKLPWPIQAGMADRFFRKYMETYTTTSHVQWDGGRQRDEDGKTILQMKVNLFWRVDNRKLILWRADGGPRLVFDLRLPKDPPASAGFGPWQLVDALRDGDDKASDKPPTPDYPYYVRSRIAIEQP